ncbi:MAG: UDP-N-acetylmuramoyl-L-alanyl-D-glutamate--2,6-diaminopimelate ligase [Treponema sp.]|nr:UDP-N-acetylmuramoyl-L-alanyl-D-glutamate--2,6-diaminopimelate ligase [Treponema sp.]
MRDIADFLNPDLVQKAGIIEQKPSAEPCKITGLEYDSRKVSAGSLFFALNGLHFDGHEFISDAIDRGAAMVVHQKKLKKYQDGVHYIRVKDSRFAMSPFSAAFYKHPSQSMAVIGVTGTEGKSTTVYLIYQLLKLLEKKAGFVSTVQQGNGLEVCWNSEHQTTPEAPQLQRLLAEMRDNGVQFAVLEASSHGLSRRTNRLGDVDFDVGVMTNITHEHLEFHGSWENYRGDKAELFRRLDASPSSHKKHIALKEGSSGDLAVPSFGVANADDPSAQFFASKTKRKTYTFSTRGAEADLSLKTIESGIRGNWYDVFDEASRETLILRDQLPGAFNVGNVLAALLVVSNLLNIEIDELVPLVSYLKPVRGRMSAVSRGQPFEVMVDYAHTPSSFKAVLPPLRQRLDSRGSAGKLICLFGSAGERDTQKRKAQGEIAANYSDIVILSDEDPRGEDPMVILEAIAEGCEAKKRNKTLFLIPNRGAAIRKAFSLARKGDLVLLLGKGHENSIIYADGPLPYDEIAEAERALGELGFSS